MPSNDLSDGRPVPAWIVSAIVHAGLLILAVVFVNSPPRGAADEPGRQVGVVLKRSTPEGEIFEGADTAALTDSAADAAADSAPDSAADASALLDATLDALPDAASENAFEQLLPDITGLGPRPDAGQAGDGDATQMTSGGGSGSPRVPAGAARTSVFGVAGEGRRFVYVFDRSGSMRGPPLAAAKQQLLASLESLGPTHEFQIVFFNYRIKSPDLTAGQGRIAFANDRNKEIAAGFVGSIVADAGTDRFAALSRALAIRPDVVFFLTDGDNAMTAAELDEIARRNQSIGATVCTIEFGLGPAHGRPNFLVQLANMTGGQYGYVDTTRLGR
ncbi:MAG: hypothetical protein AAF596_02265 [Planctomycetota bacterium]